MLPNRRAQCVGNKVLGVDICQVLVKGKVLGRALGQGDVGAVFEGVVGCVELLGQGDVEQTGGGIEVNLADHNAEHHLSPRAQSHRQGRGVDLAGDHRGGVDYLLVFKVELLVIRIARVDQSVDHGEQQLKLAKGRLDSCKGRVVETSAISSAVAPQD